ncbi:hypothetical protein QBC46DRAFT_423892 [Diplogelasinospora grovesii]|uniref:Uncharacterized protein n=1 Tax=Diplogelasinospora grovesii TaxID=303347 RepID=A0AAN6S7P3_9PEZI|nr:hypothetical protein QBC46DRAFT_423892 [Diplogelasinospora grovesii]
MLGPVQAIELEPVEGGIPGLGKIINIVKARETSAEAEDPKSVSSSEDSASEDSAPEDSAPEDPEPKDPVKLLKKRETNKRPESSVLVRLMKVIRLIKEDEVLAESDHYSSGWEAHQESDEILDNEIQDKEVPEQVPSSPSLRKWRSYIYEPAVVVPLMCAMDGKQLGILLSRSPVPNTKKADIKFRLHNPSLVCLAPSLRKDLSPLQTLYGHAIKEYKSGFQEVSGAVSTEVRFHQLVASGYTVLQERQSEWIFSTWDFDEKESRLVRRRSALGSRRPLVVFTARSPGQPRKPTFFIHVDVETPVIGFVDRTTWLGIRTLEIDMRNVSHMEIPASGGQSIVFKSRRLAATHYLSISIEKVASPPRSSGLPPAASNTQDTKEDMVGLNRRLQQILAATEDRKVELTL